MVEMWWRWRRSEQKGRDEEVTTGNLVERVTSRIFIPRVEEKDGREAQYVEQ